MWRLGRKVYLGQVGFSCAEMMSLCFLDNPLLLPTHGRRGEAPSPSPVCTHASSSVDEEMSCLTEASFVDPTDVCWVHSDPLVKSIQVQAAEWV